MFSRRGITAIILATIISALSVLPALSFAQEISQSRFPKFPSKAPVVVQESAHPLRITPEVESNIIELFASDQCDQAVAAVPRQLYHQINPLVAAVIAYCTPDEGQAEDLFHWAESQDPNRDTIYVLHARYRWKTSPEKALELWARVALITRNRATKLLAQQYLAGIGSGDEAIALGQSWRYFVHAQLGFGRESNPLGNPVSEAAHPSLAANGQFVLNLNRDTDSGAMAFGYALLNTRYFTAHLADLMEHDLEAPVSIRAGTNEDIVFRPFASYLTLGNTPYEMLGGFSVRGVAFRRDYKQYVQGSIFRDWYYRSEYKPQAGTHFRFDYTWEFFPYPWFTLLGFYVEHVRADRDTDNANQLSIVYSHNDFGFQANVEQSLKFITPAFAARVFARIDDDVSQFNSLFDNAPATRRRQDLTFELTPSLTVPVASNVQLFFSYTYNRTLSNLGPNDYTDRNIISQTLGMALKAYVIR